MARIIPSGFDIFTPGDFLGPVAMFADVPFPGALAGTGREAVLQMGGV